MDEWMYCASLTLFLLILHVWHLSHSTLVQCFLGHSPKVSGGICIYVCLSSLPHHSSPPSLCDVEKRRKCVCESDAPYINSAECRFFYKCIRPWRLYIYLCLSDS